MDIVLETSFETALLQFHFDVRTVLDIHDDESMCWSLRRVEILRISQRYCIRQRRWCVIFAKLAVSPYGADFSTLTHHRGCPELSAQRNETVTKQFQNLFPKQYPCRRWRS